MMVYGYKIGRYAVLQTLEIIYGKDRIETELKIASMMQLKA